MDFIVKLPLSEGYNSILTITDTFSKACIFIPCKETIDTAGTALLYATYVLPHYGLPSHIISNRDPCFMATIIQELCRILSIQHNTSTAYRPQTDGQSEHSNQKLEQYTRIFTDFHQTNWRHLLPLTQFCFQCLAKCHHQESTFRTHHGTHTPCPSNLQNN
jgi:transposase InsO family protein